MHHTETEICPLCQSSGIVFFHRKNRLYFQCTYCLGVYIHSQLILNANDELERYNSHNNDVEDVGYQNFVSPITNEILNNFTEKHNGLDFGAGPGPVIAKMLTDKNYKIELYDPFFHNYPELLKNKYDYVVCCEVMEHFHAPNKEFELLKSLLKPNGKLYCFTHIFDETILFDNWYYKNDPTHVFFYHKKSLAFIKESYNFSNLRIEGKLIVFS